MARADPLDGRRTMAGHWWHPLDGMQELSFKPVAQGYLYRAPSPWLFGPGRHYVVNAEQKAALAVHHCAMLRQAFWSIIAMGALAAPLASLFPPTQGTTYIGVSILIGLAIGFFLNALLVQKIKPIVAGLTPSAERITQRDMFGKQAQTFSRRYVLGFAVLSFVMLALSAARPIFDPAGRDMIAIMGIVLFGLATIYWCALFVAQCWREAA
jgi:hypothetical protein